MIDVYIASVRSFAGERLKTDIYSENVTHLNVSARTAASTRGSPRLQGRHHFCHQRVHQQG